MSPVALTSPAPADAPIGAINIAKLKQANDVAKVDQLPDHGEPVKPDYMYKFREWRLEFEAHV